MMKVLVEYIWLGGNDELRSKTRVLTTNNPALTLQDIPEWDYDGSSTGQAECKASEVVLKPKAIYRDPFRAEYDVLVLCGTYHADGTPLSNNYRDWAEEIFSVPSNEDLQPWFGLEQEYFLLDPLTKMPLGFNPKQTQGQYYCSVGTNNAFGREIVEEHMMACILAGLNMSGLNAEVAPGQWEYQVGPCLGLDAADELWVARYILERVAEKNQVLVSLEPKPLKDGDWNGSGCHTNFSTNLMRTTEDEKGLHAIYEAIQKLKKRHPDHMVVYGKGNEQRLSGKHETSQYHVFTSGKADRGASVRVGNKTIQNGGGYFEDRRPSSNMNPYLVTGIIMQTVVAV
jgi:glutamine synthetase